MENVFAPMAGERRMISESIMSATNAVFNGVPEGHKTVVIGAIEIRRGEPKAVLMVGRKFGDHWRTTFVYTGSKAEGHAVSATVTGSW